MSPSSTYMRQHFPSPRGESSTIFKVVFVEMKYFQENIIRKHVDRHPAYSSTRRNRSAVVVDNTQNVNLGMVLDDILPPGQVVGDVLSILSF